MKIQSLERTFIDKVFALCDYYIQKKSKRYSRHIYDIYKLKELISFDENFSKLVREVRNHRAKMKICPSAKEDVKISALVHEFCENAFYKQDYMDITCYFLDDMVERQYENAVDTLLMVVDKGFFD